MPMVADAISRLRGVARCRPAVLARASVSGHRPRGGGYKCVSSNTHPQRSIGCAVVLEETDSVI
jgi:ribosomal protein L34E